MPSVDAVKRELRSYIGDSKRMCRILGQEEKIISDDLEQKRNAFRAALNPLHGYLDETGLKKLERVIARSGLQIKAVADVQKQKEMSTESSDRMKDSLAKHGSDEYLDQKIGHAIDAKTRLGKAYTLISSIIENQESPQNGQLNSVNEVDLFLSFARTHSALFGFANSGISDIKIDPHANTSDKIQRNELARLYLDWEVDLEALKEEKKLRRQLRPSIVTDEAIETRLADKIAKALAKNKSVKSNFVSEYGEYAGPVMLALAKQVAVEQFHTQIITQETRLLDGIEQLEKLLSKLDKAKGHKDIKIDLSNINITIGENAEKMRQLAKDIELRRKLIQEYTPHSSHNPRDYFNHLFLYFIAYQNMDGGDPAAAEKHAHWLIETFLEGTPHFDMSQYDMDAFNIAENLLHNLQIKNLSAAVEDSIDAKMFDDLSLTKSPSNNWQDYSNTNGSETHFNMD